MSVGSQPNKNKRIKQQGSAFAQPTEEQMELFIEMFMGRLPEYLRRSLAGTMFAV